MHRIWPVLKLIAIGCIWLSALQLILNFQLPDLAGHLHPDTLIQYAPASTAESIEYWRLVPDASATWSIVLSAAALSVALWLPRQRRLAMILIVAVVARHLYWRLTETLQFNDPVSALFGSLLMLAEIYGITSIVLGCIQMYRPILRRPPLEAFHSGFMPTVDILIPTYSEPLEVLTRTITGCQAVIYPGKQVYVLDDGRRPEVRDLCDRLGCYYITRKDNAHAKAGNLNNALAQIHGELVVVFDADHVPLKTFLQRTVPYFTNPKLAFIQTPQHFCTPDPFQRNLIAEQTLENEQDLFYHVIMPGMDNLGAVTFAGSGTIFRRSALDEVGGFAVETVTEDLHTGLKLHERGWKSIYVNEDLASGLAPESFEDFVAQRVRWCQGAIQIFRLEDILAKKTLTWAQKLSYFNALWYFFQGIPRLIFLLVPLVYLLFGISTITANYLEVTSYYLCYFLVTSVGYTQITGNSRQTQWSELYETALCFHLAVVAVTTWINPRQAVFKVTPKGKTQNGISCRYSLIAPHMVILLLCLLGLGLGAWRANTYPETLGLILWNYVWVGYNMFLVVCAMLSAVNRPQKRACPRIKREMPVTVETALGVMPGKTSIISQGGATLILDEPVPVSDTLQVTLKDDSLKIDTVVSSRVVHSAVLPDKRHRINVRFVDMTPQLEKRLILHTFTAANVWEDYHRVTPPVQSVINLIRTPLRWFKVREKSQHRFAPRFTFERMAVILDEDDRYLGLSRIDNISETGARILLSASVGNLPMLGTYKLVFNWDEADRNSTEELRMQIVTRQAEGKSEAIGVIFPSLSRTQVHNMHTYLYKRRSLRSDFVDIMESRNRFKEYLQERWNIDLTLEIEREPLIRRLAC